MWIVRLALRRPYTFVVMSLLILILGTLSVYTTPIDIFPNIDIPILAVVYGYAGLSAEDISQRLVVGFERGLTATVNDVEHIESQSLNGLGVIKIFFYPNVRIDMALAQVTAHRAIRRPAGSPGHYSTVYPGLQRVLRPDSSARALRKGPFRAAVERFRGEFLRSQLATVQGAVFPNPYGGKQRQVQVDLNIPALQAKGLSPNDVVTRRSELKT